MFVTGLIKNAYMYRDVSVFGVVQDSYTRLCVVRELVFALERCKLVFEQTRLNLRNTGEKNSWKPW